MIGSLTIYQRIVALTAAAILLSLGAMMLVTFRGPPPSARPLSLDDVQLIVGGQPMPDWRVERSMAAGPPAIQAPDQRLNVAMSTDIAQQIGVDPDTIRLFTPPHPGPHMDRSLRDAFTLAIRQGPRWLILRAEPRPAILRWYAVTLGLMGIVFIVLMLPVRRVARTIGDPIARLAAAAENDGPAGTVDTGAEGPPEIRALVSAMDEMHRRIRAQDRDRAALLRAIAHDLRTPMTRLSFRVDKLPDDQRDRAQSDIAEMRTMISAILDFMDGHHAPRLNRVEAASLIGALVENYREQGADIALTADDRLVVMADAVLLRRVVQNVIDNALRYAGNAHVSLRADATMAQIVIEDQGPGIPPALIARATEPFWREETSRARSTGGVGLGLAIVQEAMIAMNGQLSIANGSERGLSVTLSLPLAG